MRLPIVCHNHRCHLITGKDRLYIFSAHLSTVNFHMRGHFYQFLERLVGCVAQLAERRFLAGELTLSCARPAADG